MQASLKGLSSTIRANLVDTFYNNPTTRAAIKHYMKTYQVSTGLRKLSSKSSSKGVAEPQEWQSPLLQRWGPTARTRRLLEAKVEEKTSTMAVDDDEDVAIDFGNTLSDEDEAEAPVLFWGIGSIFGRHLFDAVEVKKALNDIITAQDVNNLVNLYSQNIDKFYIDFENLCQVKNKHPNGTIVAMEHLMIQNTNQETFNTINNILAGISASATNEIVREFQTAMAPVRQHILNTFVALYNNVKDLCQCQDMINAAPSLGVPQNHIIHHLNVLGGLCDEACAPTHGFFS